MTPVSPLNELNPIGTDNYYPFIPFTEMPSIASMSNLVASKEISTSDIGSRRIKKGLINVSIALYSALNNVNPSDLI